MSRRAIHTVIVSLLPALPVLAHAHVADEMGHAPARFQALAAGFTHPFTGLDHLAALLAVGAWTALSRQAFWQAPLAFLLALLSGALLASAGVPFSLTEFMIAASVLVLGLLLASRRGLPWQLGMALTAVFAFFHGAAHGQELAGPQFVAAVAGMLLGSALLLAGGLGLGSSLRRTHVAWPRLLGSALACFGAVLLVLR